LFTLQSTGRGGAGNFRRAESISRDPVLNGDERGREVNPHPDAPTHSGRGGAGNVRSPSRNPEARQAEIDAIKHEREVIEATREHERTQIHSSGRGGLGNMSASPAASPSRNQSNSRSRSRDPTALLSTGRGGAGNIRSESRDTRDLTRLDEEERKTHSHAEGIHSTGRGGAGNLTSAHEPSSQHGTGVAPTDSTEFHSSGRGGAGNIHEGHRGRPAERDTPAHGHNVVEDLWHKVTGKD